MSLPPEIRNEIYELVCGGQFLHVWGCWKDKKFEIHHDICRAVLSETTVEDLFYAGSSAQWSASAIEARHDGCTTTRGQFEKISTSFLSTCHQVYNEAWHVPYTTNTFSFRSCRTLDEFTNYLTKSESGHHLEIRRVHVDIVGCSFAEAQWWNSTITRSLIPRLPEVHQISINLNWWYLAGVIRPWTPAEFEAHSTSGGHRYHLMSALLELRRLPLKRTTFTISNSRGFNERQPLTDAEGRQSCWTFAEIQAWARYVKDSILRKDSELTFPSSLVVQEQGKRVANAELVKPKLLEG